MPKVQSPPLYPNNLRAWRRRAGLTQQDIADRMGMTQGAIGKIERGDVRLYATNAQRLAPILGCEVWDLLDGNEPDELQRSLLDLLDILPPDKRRTLLRLGRALAEEATPYAAPEGTPRTHRRRA